MGHQLSLELLVLRITVWHKVMQFRELRGLITDELDIDLQTFSGRGT